MHVGETKLEVMEHAINNPFNMRLTQLSSNQETNQLSDKGRGIKKKNME